MDLIIKTVKREKVQANHTTKPVLNAILAAPSLFFFPLYLALACPFSTRLVGHSPTRLQTAATTPFPTNYYLSLSLSLLSTLYSSLPLYINQPPLVCTALFLYFQSFFSPPNSHSNQLVCI